METQTPSADGQPRHQIGKMGRREISGSIDSASRRLLWCRLLRVLSAVAISAMGWLEAASAAVPMMVGLSPTVVLGWVLGLLQSTRAAAAGVVSARGPRSAALFFDNLAAVRVASNPMRNASF